MTSLILIVTTEFEPGIREQWLAHFATLAPPMRAEPGCLALFAAADPESPTRVHILEHYRDAEAFDDHIRSPHLAAFREAITSAGLTPKQSVVQRYDATERA